MVGDLQSKTNSLRMALTAALEKGADVVGGVILIARLTVAENMQNKQTSVVVWRNLA
jgi:orotate phosphoribosyltransferase